MFGLSVVELLVIMVIFGLMVGIPAIVVAAVVIAAGKKPRQ
jgi:hypothetical protein